MTALLTGSHRRAIVIASVALALASCLGGGMHHHPEAPPVSGDNPVIVYGTSWCPYTAAAQAYLAAHNVPFTFRDVERIQRLREEMDRKVDEAGATFTGIPVIEVRGHVLVGYDSERLRHALRAEW